MTNKDSASTPAPRRITDSEQPQTTKPDVGNFSDGFHTFNELYDHRCTLFLALMKAHPSLSWISSKHHDGSAWDGWFIAGIKAPTGDVTYHLPVSMWSLACKTGAAILETGMWWDGHTPAQVVERIQAWVAITPAAPTPEAVPEWSVVRHRTSRKLYKGHVFVCELAGIGDNRDEHEIVMALNAGAATGHAPKPPAVGKATDAARYRWLRDGKNTWHEDIAPVIMLGGDMLAGDKLDSAIDAALQSKREGAR